MAAASPALELAVVTHVATGTDTYTPTAAVAEDTATPTGRTPASASAACVLDAVLFTAARHAATAATRAGSPPGGTKTVARTEVDPTYDEEAVKPVTDT